MPRSALRVRPAVESDLPALVHLGTELREALLPVDNVVRPTSPAGRALLEQRFRDAIGSVDRHLVIVVGTRDEPFGMALFTVAPANALFAAQALHVTHAVVADRHRRRGAGRALVAAAAAHAEEHGLDQVVFSVRAGSREANRFFARLGFAPLAVRRAASVTTIRRSLARSEPVGAVRRRSRRQPPASIPEQPTCSSPAPVGDPEPGGSARS